MKYSKQHYQKWNPEYYIDKDKIINNKEDVVKGFSKFFENLGPNGAEIINGPETTEGVDESLGSKSQLYFPQCSGNKLNN